MATLVCPKMEDCSLLFIAFLRGFPGISVMVKASEFKSVMQLGCQTHHEAHSKEKVRMDLC